MNIEKILELRYADCQWELRGDSYEDLNWLDQETPKPTEQELQDIWDNEVFTIEVSDSEAIENRKQKIISYWPVDKQFEAITENSMGRPEKLNELLGFISGTINKIVQAYYQGYTLITRNMSTKIPFFIAI